MTLAERLLARSVAIPIAGCRLWEGYVNPRTGYGEVHYDGRTETTHRAAWIAFKGDPGPLHVLHRCDVRPCLNPDHLFLGSNIDNIRDSMSKGRREGVKRNRPHGLKYRVTTATHDKKRKVPLAEWPTVMSRVQGGETQAAVAKSYNVHQSVISRIVARA